MIGKSIGRFEIVAPLGTGGMATVWRARDPLLNRDVAVKILDQRFSGSKSAKKRFKHEGEIAALMSHPGICAVHEAGEQDGMTYLVMALIEGRTLSELAAQRLMPIDEALGIGVSAADALGYAHARGVVHRDVTGRNIMVRGDGSVVLLDFGIALAYGVSRVTSTGHMLGTPAYMAPESLRGEVADPRTDVYGLGVVLYEALTGALPFAGERPEVIRFRALNETADAPSVLRPEITPEIDGVVLKAMSFEPGQRHIHAQQLASELRACLGGSGRIAPARRTTAPEFVGDPSQHDSNQTTITAPGSEDMGTRVAAGRQPLYVLIPPIELRGSDTANAGARAALDDIAEATRAGIADMQKIRVVESPNGTTDDVAATALQAGANMVLVAHARTSGETLRLTFRFIDPSSGTIYGGDNVEGSLVDPFPLEERFINAVRSSLGRAFQSVEPAARPADPAAANRMAQALSNLKRFDHEASVDGAISILETLRQSEGKTAPVMAALCRAYLAKQELTRERRWSSKAAIACDLAARCDPEATETLLAQAELKLSTGHPHGALADADRALQRQPDLYEAQIARARALDLLGNESEATRTCHAVLAARPKDWRGYHTLGMLLLRRGRYAEAVAPFREVTRLVRDNAGGYRQLGNAYYYLELHDEAKAAWEKSIDVRPTAMTYYNLGTLSFFRRQYEECLEAFEQAVALNQHDAHAWGNLGAACKSIPGQEARMQEALDRAISLMQEELRGDSAKPESWGRLAGWYSNLNQHDQAVECVEKALERGPDVVDCMLRAAHVYLSAGDRDRAIHWLQEAVRRGHSTENLTQDRELDELRDDPRFKKLMEEETRPDGTREDTR